ncbi:MAG: arsenate reductase ArsC [Anaerorhabdus sp.]
MENKIKVAFVCVHNSCRSQIAETLCKKLAADMFDCYSAGTVVVDKINPDAVRLLKQIHNIDMEETQFSKLITDLPPIDILITMGCNVECPAIPHTYHEDWGLEDPSGKCDEEFLKTIYKIERNILQLKRTVQNNNL